MNRLSTDPCFTLKYSLKGDCKDSITGLAFSDDGKFLACSSSDGNVVVYNVMNGSKAATFRSDSFPTVLAWGLGRELVTGLNDGGVILYYNATRGQGPVSKFFKPVFLFVESPDHQELADLGKPIATLAFHRETKRLFVASGSSVGIYRRRSQNDWVYLCTIDLPPFEYTEVGFELDDPYPTKILFPRMKDQVFVCYRDHGIRFSFGSRRPGTGPNHVYRNYRIIDDRNIEVIWSIPPDNRICPASLSPDNNTIVAWNLNEGLDFYCTRRANLKLIETLDLSSASNTEVNLMLDIQYILNGKAVLVGSNSGAPFIVHVATKEVIQTLKHSNMRASTPINAYWSQRGQHYITTADRDNGEETLIKLWHLRPSYGWLGNVWLAKTFHSGFYFIFLHCLILGGFVALRWPLEWRYPVVGGIALIGRIAQTLSRWAERMDASNFAATVSVSVDRIVSETSEIVKDSYPMNSLAVAAVTTVTSTETVTVMEAVMPTGSTELFPPVTHPPTCAVV
ncbi:hypothetical protein E1B28_000158 [Marasmius oreades]|uniref:Uncharacterized protein n=1 Tax=Marasmius oreades TaxID=181124 RepID=A0A9P8AEB1_9AGAR|nr:uncharacterized protein E1B28_000158 [Marasmius oreades]KAG7098190.1 hypothetical protein E1B28_000158 [Marasmius oreades]